MFTIKELEDRWNDYESACLLTIKQLLSERKNKEISFDSDDLSIRPVCIGRYGYNLIDGVIYKVYIGKYDKIYVLYKDRNNPNLVKDEQIIFINCISFTDLIWYLKNKLKNE